jgi:hypothetical protein
LGGQGRADNARTRAMPDRDPDRANDTKALTPLLLMALLIAVGLMFSVYMGNAPA